MSEGSREGQKQPGAAQALDEQIAQWRALPRDVRIAVVINVKARAADLLDEAKESGQDVSAVMKALMQTAHLLKAIGLS